jgi:hypothetical protein
MVYFLCWIQPVLFYQYNPTTRAGLRVKSSWSCLEHYVKSLLSCLEVGSCLFYFCFRSSWICFMFAGPCFEFWIMLALFLFRSSYFCFTYISDPTVILHIRSNWPCMAHQLLLVFFSCQILLALFLHPIQLVLF